MSEPVQVDIELLGRHFTIATPPDERETLQEAVRLLEECPLFNAGIGSPSWPR